MDDLIGEFITETSESLAVLDQELVKLEQNPNDKGILGNIFRLVHTIKGTCGFLGLPRLEAVAHAGENVLGKIRDDVIAVSPEAISIVLQALDAIKAIMEFLSANGSEPEGNDTDLIARLNAFAESNGGSAAAAKAGPAEAKKPESSGGMKLPDTEGGLAQSVLDELERAFMEATPTVDGGMAAPIAAPRPPEPEPQAEEPKPAVPQAVEAPKAAPAVSEAAKDKAVKQGLAAGKEKAPAAPAGGGADASIRVNLDVLENLMQMVGELVLNRNQLLQIVRNRDDNELKTPLQQLSNITTELQEAVMKTRMQPIGNAWAKFPRLIRDLSIELAKKIDLRMVGAETELDRQLLEMIKDPLTHMVRNSCDHGLERPDERAANGKPETGTVTLSAFHEGGHIIVQITDDGRGINIARVKQKSIENGLATEAELDNMSEQQILQFIFKPGFSTAEKVTSVSGRGVGMDVVRTNIEKIGGTVELSTQAGKGSVFHIKIPLTLAIVSVLIVEAAQQRFAIPQINVLELVRTSPKQDYKIEMINQSPVLRLRDRLLPLLSLAEALQISNEGHGSYDERECFVAVCRVGENDFGVIVDRIFDTEEIVVKPVSEMLKNIPLYSGNTILGDGSVIMILDPNGLAKSAGELDGAGKQQLLDDARNKQAGADKMVSFLVFRAGGGAPKAVPLELVSRLEEIDVTKIEFSGDRKVIQYRDDLMRLSTLHCNDVPTDGICEVIVFTYDNKTVGLVVDEILDIVEAPLVVKMTSSEEAYLGSLVINNKTTDLVDIGYLLRDLVSDPTAFLSSDSRAAGDFNLMLVEDSIFFHKLIVPFLEHIGYQVTAFTSAPEALSALYAGRKFDAIITDIEMPEMDGFEFAEKVRGDKRFDKVPLIAFTSSINQQFVERSQEIGMNEFILKTDREALAGAVNKHLSGDHKEAA